MHRPPFLHASRHIARIGKLISFIPPICHPLPTFCAELSRVTWRADALPLRARAAVYAERPARSVTFKHRVSLDVDGVSAVPYRASSGLARSSRISSRFGRGTCWVGRIAPNHRLVNKSLKHVGCKKLVLRFAAKMLVERYQDS